MCVFRNERTKNESVFHVYLRCLDNDENVFHVYLCLFRQRRERFPCVCVLDSDENVFHVCLGEFRHVFSMCVCV